MLSLPTLRSLFFYSKFEGLKCEMKCNRLLLFSGWYSEEPSNDERDVLQGSDLIRDPEFHDLWLSAAQKFLNPSHILITDSNSPRKSPLVESEDLTWIRLPNNPGHSTSAKQFYCGYSVGVLNGLIWAFINDFAHAVYVEQDALIFGDKFFEACQTSARNGIAFGSGSGTPQPIQQSLMYFSREAIPRFINRLLTIPYADSVLSCEEKFSLAASRIPNFLIRKKLSIRFARVMARLVTIRPSFGLFQFGYGRARPIHYSDSNFYFQHGTLDEVQKFMEKSGVGMPDKSERNP